jgi:hypothetical protein
MFLFEYIKLNKNGGALSEIGGVTTTCRLATAGSVSERCFTSYHHHEFQT